MALFELSMKQLSVVSVRFSCPRVRDPSAVILHLRRRSFPLVSTLTINILITVTDTVTHNHTDANADKSFNHVTFLNSERFPHYCSWPPAQPSATGLPCIRPSYTNKTNKEVHNGTQILTPNLNYCISLLADQLLARHNENKYLQALK